MGKCSICGKSSGFFPICKNCNEMKEKGLISKCEICGTWHKSNEECHNCKQPKIEPDTKSDNELKCIICGNNSNGKHFCLNCYKKYSNKEIVIKITKCQPKSEILDNNYTSEFTSKDGHFVKSKSEVFIDNYLYENNIQHAYEKALQIDGNKNHDIHPDFYINELKNDKGEIIKNIYLEHWGYNDSNSRYEESKEYKLKIYKNLGITLITTTEDDMKQCEESLNRKLKYFKKGEINE